MLIVPEQPGRWTRLWIRIVPDWIYNQREQEARAAAQAVIVKEATATRKRLDALTGAFRREDDAVQEARTASRRRRKPK